MTGVLAVLAASKKTAPITVPSSWGLTSVAAPNSLASATRTLTVPAGNPGKVVLTFSDSGCLATPQYKKNGGTPTSFSFGDVVTFADGDTLAFQASNGEFAGTLTATATDQATSTLIGTAQMQFV
jgi:hypothetical protein